MSGRNGQGQLQGAAQRLFAKYLLTRRPQAQRLRWNILSETLSSFPGPTARESPSSAWHTRPFILCSLLISSALNPTSSLSHLTREQASTACNTSDFHPHGPSLVHIPVSAVKTLFSPAFLIPLCWPAGAHVSPLPETPCPPSYPPVI